MARKPTGNPAGRPEKEIDWKQFEELCALQCIQDEIANILKVCGPTLAIKVKEYYGEDYLTIYKRYSDSGKCSLRRYQFVQSKKSATMAIWLGKNWLGQKDSQSDAHIVNPETLQACAAVVTQLNKMQEKAQEERKIDDNSINAQAKS